MGNYQKIVSHVKENKGIQLETLFAWCDIYLGIGPETTRKYIDNMKALNLITVDFVTGEIKIGAAKL